MKKPLKITIIVSVILILAIVLSVAVYLKDSIRAPALLTKSTREELSIWPRFSGNVWWTENKLGDIRYYGTYNGWHIISQSSVAETKDIIIGEYTFYLPQRTIYAVKGTKKTDIRTLYGVGLLDDKDIAKIYEYHTYVEAYEREIMEAED